MSRTVRSEARPNRWRATALAVVTTLAVLTVAATFATLTTACSAGGKAQQQADASNVFANGSDTSSSPTSAGAPVTDDAASRPRDAETTTTISTGPATTVISVAPDEPSSLPFEFKAVDLGGTAVDGSAYYAKTPLVVVFVSPWCPVCIQEGPLLANTVGSHPDVTFMLVHASGSAAEYKQYLDAAGIVGTNVVNVDDTDGALWRRFSVKSQPTFVLVDTKGLMRSATGSLDQGMLDEAASRAVAGFS